MNCFKLNIDKNLQDYMDITPEKTKLQKTAQILGVTNQKTRYGKLINLLIERQQTKTNRGNKETTKFNSS